MSVMAQLLHLWTGGLGVLLLLGLGMGVGGMRERRHLRSLVEREQILGTLALGNMRNVPSDWRVSRATLVQGQAVIASDYFKTFAAKLRTLFGGEVRSLETLMDRGRREATLRMLEEALSMNADVVINIRLETSTIGRGLGANRGAAMAEVFAYGTALALNHDQETPS